jgi:hypothetical protein
MQMEAQGHVFTGNYESLLPKTSLPPALSAPAPPAGHSHRPPPINTATEDPPLVFNVNASSRWDAASIATPHSVKPDDFALSMSSCGRADTNAAGLPPTRPGLRVRGGGTFLSAARQICWASARLSTRAMPFSPHRLPAALSGIKTYWSTCCRPPLYAPPPPLFDVSKLGQGNTPTQSDSSPMMASLFAPSDGGFGYFNGYTPLANSYTPPPQTGSTAVNAVLSPTAILTSPLTTKAISDNDEELSRFFTDEELAKATLHASAGFYPPMGTPQFSPSHFLTSPMVSPSPSLFSPLMLRGGGSMLLTPRQPQQPQQPPPVVTSDEGGGAASGKGRGRRPPPIILDASG